MSIASPQIVTSKSLENINSPVIFIQIESDRGDTGGIKVVNTLGDFYIEYHSSSQSETYKLAEYLLNIGFRLIIQRVNSSSGYQSVRLLSGNSIKSLTGTTDRAYPGYDVDYSQSLMSEGDVSGNTYSYAIVINRSITDTDYILLHNGLVWNIIYFNRASVPLPANSYFRSYYCNKSATAIYNLLISKLGYSCKLSTSGSTTTIIMEYNKMMTPNTTFEDSYIPEEVNNDRYCRYTDNYKVLDVFSRYKGSTEDLVINVTKLLDSYQFKFSMLDVENDIPIHEEYYTLVASNEESLQESINIINMRSSLFNLVYYGGTIPTGEFPLRRGCTTESATINDYISQLSNKELYDFYPDIALEYYESTQEYHDEFMKVIQGSPTPNVVLSQYNEDIIYNSKFLLNLFSGYISINGYDYPSYLYYLILLSKQVDEGQLSNISINDQVTSDEIEVNIISETEYGVSELHNPVGYLTKDNIVPTGLLVAHSIAINNLIRTVDTVTLTENILNSQLQFSVQLANSLTGTSISMELTNYSVDSRLVTFTLSVSLNYQLSKQFELIISVTRSS